MKGKKFVTTGARKNLKGDVSDTNQSHISEKFTQKGVIFKTSVKWFKEFVFM